MDKLFITIVLLTALIAGYVVYDTSKDVGIEIDQQTQTAGAIWNKTSPAGVSIKEGQKPLEGVSNTATEIENPRGNYILSSVNGKTVEGGEMYTMLITDTKISGRICNSFSSNYKTIGTVLEAGPLAATKMACPGNPGEYENIFFSLIASKPIFDNQDGQMTLTSGNNSIVFEHVYE